jgi:SprT protein
VVRFHPTAKAVGFPAHYRKYSIRKHMIMVNAILFSENVEEYLNQTIPHEVAHAFQSHLYRNCGYRVMPHGSEWKRIMIKFGKNPKRTHSYDVSNAVMRRVQKNYIYICNCKSHHYLTATCHNRAKKAKEQGRNAYRCRICKVDLIHQPENNCIAA